VEIILTHNNADFDAAAALLGAYKLFPAAVPVLSSRLNRNVAEFVALYQNGLPFIAWDNLQGEKVKRIVLVDTQKTPDVRDLPTNTPIFIIDHHPKRAHFGSHETFTGEEVGATVTLLVEQMRQKGITLSSLEATLLALGIYEDTGSLTYSLTTPRDITAAAWLLEQGAVLDTVRRFLTKSLNEEQQILLEKLLKTAETRVIEGYTIIVCAVMIDTYIDQINSVAHRLRDLLECEALFVLVEHPTGIQLVSRATGDAIDVGTIARSFGGGGHARASAASIEDTMLSQVLDKLWRDITAHIQPVTRVADLMSYGVQIVEADKPLTDVIHQLRRIGHEGYPVVERGRVVGLLTRRSADRALEHGLSSVSVRDIMDSGTITLKRDESLSRLEQVMVTSGWGQIPIIDDDEKIIGIVTRTDLIKHWTKTHPKPDSIQDQVSPDQIKKILSEPVARLIETISRYTEEAGINLYMVGGVVRDLLLGRPNLDLDFVVEGDAIRLADDLKALYGGTVNSFRPFGTAKWRLDSQVAEKLGLANGVLPEHIDFATSRNEFYEHPTALPTVYNSSIKLDLGRRDFTMNTLAIQLSPAGAKGRILDFYGGLRDLNNRTIRVLHSLSFVDDPTRILRAVRFQQRLNFEIEPRTKDLMDTAQPMLRRITGGRLRDELHLLMREKMPQKGLVELQKCGVLQGIHPDFILNPQIEAHFQAAQTSAGKWPLPVPDIADLHWHLVLSAIAPDRLLDLCERLLFARAQSQSFADAAGLVQQPASLVDANALPSQITTQLEDHSELALLTAWILAPLPIIRQRIEKFLTEWRSIRPKSDGNTLQSLGLLPGPRYRIILDRLRAARLDGEIQDETQERQLLEALVQGMTHDRT